MLPGINQIRPSMFGVLFMIKSFSSCSIEGQVAGKRFSCVKNAFKCPPFPTKSPVTTFLEGFLHGGRKILEDGTTFRWVLYIQKFWSVSVSSLVASFFAWFRIESSEKRE